MGGAPGVPSLGFGGEGHVWLQASELWGLYLYVSIRTRLYSSVGGLLLADAVGAGSNPVPIDLSSENHHSVTDLRTVTDSVITLFQHTC